MGGCRVVEAGAGCGGGRESRAAGWVPGSSPEAAGLISVVGLLVEVTGVEAVVVGVTQGGTVRVVHRYGARRGVAFLGAGVTMLHARGVPGYGGGGGGPVVETGSAALAAAGLGGCSVVSVGVMGSCGSPVGSVAVLLGPQQVVTSQTLGVVAAVAGLVGDQLELGEKRSDAAAAADTPRSAEPDSAGRVGAGGGTSPGVRAVSPREVADGVAAGEVLAWFQPVVNLGSGRRDGVEALARWRSPTRGLVPPGVFVPVAERSHLAVELDLAVWEHALSVVAARRRVEPGLRVSLNFSARHTHTTACPDRLSDLVARAGVPPGAVDVELTESVHLGPHAHGVLTELRARGFGVLIDDFGTGWATLAAVLELPHDGLKIDRSITSKLHTPAAAAVVHGITAGVGRIEGYRVIAEGVETAAQATALVELGLTHGQGYHWQRPHPTLTTTPDPTGTDLTGTDLTGAGRDAAPCGGEDMAGAEHRYPAAAAGG